MNDLTIKMSRTQLDTILLALVNDINNKEKFFEGFKTKESKIKYSFSYNHCIACKKIIKKLEKI